jgi:replicative DNA helicase
MVDVVLELHKHMDNVLDKDIIGVPTGFHKFDMVTGGLVKGDMIVLAARPSVGKSAFLGALAVNAAQNSFKARIISLEMSNVQIGARLGSLVSDVEFYKIFRNRMDDERQREELYSKLETLSNLDIKISDKTKVNINDIRAKVGQLKSKDDIDILFVDYLQLLDSEEGSGKSFSREQEVSRMSRGFKLMAKEFNIPIVVLAQLNRESEKSANKKPALHHLRESGAIEQDADLVVFLHRDWKVGIQQNEHGQTTEFEADLIIAKGRNIETPEIKIGFDGAKMKFYDKDKVNYNEDKF